jgi:phage terminase large subunit
MKRTLKVNHKLVPFITKPQPIKVAIGGRGSGKSLGIGDLLTFKMDSEGADIYCLREFQESIIDSVHKVFRGSIQDRLKLDNWKIFENRIEAPNGARTTYKGANKNPDAMQSAQGYKYSWFEEAHRASQASLDKLLPTILRNPGSQCWFSANPQSSGDPFSQRFIVPYQKQLEEHGFYEDDLHYIVVVNWRDNPWWNEEQEALRSWDYKNVPRAKYDWIWEGRFMDTVDDAIIKPEWFDACIDAHIKLGWKATGKKIVSHDPSDRGDDAKGLTYRHGSVVHDVQERTFGDVAEGVDWSTSYAIRVGAQDYIWDADGLGLGLRRDVADNFKGHNIQQHAFRGGETPDNPNALYDALTENAALARTNADAFKNKRSQNYARLRDRCYTTFRAVVHGEYHDPDEMISFSSEIEAMQALRAEVCRIPEKVNGNGNGKFQIMSKPDMKRILGIDSPNMADSVMMSLAIPDKIVNNTVAIPPPIKPMGHRHGSGRNQRTR